MGYRILFKERPEKELLKKIKEKHQHDIEGISALYDQLIEDGVCDTRNAAAFYYVAYTLALEDIELILARVN